VENVSKIDDRIKAKPSLGLRVSPIALGIDAIGLAGSKQQQAVKLRKAAIALCLIATELDGGK
jgi:hypothetical protein